MMRRLVYALSAAVVVLASAYVTVPFIEYRPGSATSIDELVTLGTPTTPIDGAYDLLTIRVATPSLGEALLIWADGDRDLTPRSEAIPSDVPQDVYRELQLAQFSRSFRTAVGVGARAAGFDATVRTRPVVFQVLTGGPSDGLLDVGDVLRALDGQPIESAEELIELLRARTEPGEIVLEVQRSGESRDVTVTTELLPGLEQPGIGIVVDTIAEEVELPFDAELAETNIGGPSAGMMIALTTYDLLSEEDLAGGRTIAGTGTIDGDGRVGRIGGISEKVVAAQRAAVDLLLVPESQLDAALADADGSVRIVGVATLDEAIAALRAGRA
jgi:PDZ domain-containing protein